jgi:pimeloyl-ACP methyl ester carboxylesterase
MRAHVLSFAAATCLAFAVTGCAEHTPTAPATRFAPTASANVTSEEPGFGPWARIVKGETGPGSLYAIHIPQNWNGATVHYVHGIRPPLDPVTLDGVTMAGLPEPNGQDGFFAVREGLGEKGYAFVYSSFSENGLALKDGAQRTHQLRGVVASQLGGQPERNYLLGYSLGALIAMNLAERFPGQYNGVMAACGMIGGTQRELQYIGDVRALFDAFFPGVLPGDAITPPVTPLTVAQLQQRVVAAISQPATATQPSGAMKLFAIASTVQTPLAFAPIGSLTDPRTPAFQSLVGSLVTALYYQHIGIPDVLDRTHNHSPYGNVGVTYSLRAPVIPDPNGLLGDMIADANTPGGGAAVTRYEMSDEAREYFTKYYQPTGRVAIPTLTIHNLFDPLVPFFHESDFKAIVGTDGAGMLLQRPVPNYAHCAFDKNLIVKGVVDLDNWATSGIKPLQ